MTSIDTIIDRQLKKWELESRAAAGDRTERPLPAPIVTVSRQTGSRGSYFASRLAQKLNYQRLHREVIDAICHSSGYRKKVIESLDENFRGELDLLVESLFSGQSVDHSDYIRHLGNVILSLSQLGGVIVMGRGSNFILGPRRGFHIRVVCHRDQRIENLINYVGRSKVEAVKEIDASDEQRRAFIKKLFECDIDSPLHYDLVMNSALIDVEEMVATAAIAIHAKMDKLAHLDDKESAS